MLATDVHLGQARPCTDIVEYSAMTEVAAPLLNVQELELLW